MINNLIYVYCITKSPYKLPPGMKLKGLKSLMFDDFCVIVRYASDNEFSEENFKKNLSDLQWLDSNARGHIDVVTTIMETCAVIPFKFGTVYNTVTGLEKFINDYKGSLAENFLIIEGKEEWSVKIYCDRKLLCEQIDELSSEAAKLEKEVMNSSPGKAFLLKRKKTDVTETEMDRICKEKGQGYYDGFRDLSESSSLNNLLPKELTGREDTMILNATFLVNKTLVTEFINAADNLQRNEVNSGFLIEVTGPWPPFSFISIKENQLCKIM